MTMMLINTRYSSRNIPYPISFEYYIVFAYNVSSNRYTTTSELYAISADYRYIAQWLRCISNIAQSGVNPPPFPVPPEA